MGHIQWRRGLCALLCLLLVLSVRVASANAYEIQKTRVSAVIVMSQGATLRSSPENKGSQNKIKALSANTIMQVGGIVDGWYYVYVNGDYGFVNANPEWTRILAYWPEVAQRERGMTSLGEGPGGSYDMGVPNLNGVRFGKDDTSMVVLWVQAQLKATKKFYQGDEWDVTGTIGSHTMKEIAAFMESRGYPYHSGEVNQMVIDNLADSLGEDLVPVYIGGMYDYMDSLMSGGVGGTMFSIISNTRYKTNAITTGARWVQTCLRKIGYYAGVVDGMYGQELEDAVKRFQKDYGFEQRDFVSLGVARTMLEVYFAAGGDLDALP